MPKIIMDRELKTIVCYMFGILLALSLYVYQKDMGYLKGTLSDIKEESAGMRAKVDHNSLDIARILGSNFKNDSGK